MKKLITGSASVVALTLLLSTSGPVAAADKQFISIGTGGVTGVYFPTGGAICRLVNKARKTHGIRCSVEATGGSIYNINTVRSGELEFGIAQSDWQYHAYHGTSKFKDKGKFSDLRAVFSLHLEAFTMVARKDAGIKNIVDIKGKKVNIGNPGSGTRATTELALKTAGIKVSDLALAAELKPSEMAQALCDGKVDAITYTVGHPNAAIKEAASSCAVNLVNVKGAAFDKLIKDNPYYSVATIPGGLYPGSPKPTTTFGVGATLITSAKVSNDVVHAVVKTVFDNIAEFKKLHTVFGNLDPKQMAKDGLSAPIHDGAAKYFKARGF